MDLWRIGALICGRFVGSWVCEIYGEFMGYDSKARFEKMVGFGGWWRSVGFQVGFDFVFRWIGGFPTWRLVLIL